MKEEGKSSYIIHNILLGESNFKRLDALRNESVNHLITADVGNNIDGNKINCILKVSIESKYEDDTTEAEFSVTYVGLFEKTGDAKVTLETFAKVNGPAIMYGYIREHIANLSLKGGLKVIHIPPIDFLTPNLPPKNK